MLGAGDQAGDITGCGFAPEGLLGSVDGQPVLVLEEGVERALEIVVVQVRQEADGIPRVLKGDGLSVGEPQPAQ